MKQKSLLKTMLLLFALIAGSSSVWAQSGETTQTLTFNTAAGQAKLTIVKAGTSSTGGDMELRQSIFVLTSALGYDKSNELNIYKSGSLTISLADGSNGYIKSVKVTYANSYPFATPAGWTATSDVDSWSSTSKISAGKYVTYSTTATTNSSVTLTNNGNGKTTPRSIEITYVVSEVPATFAAGKTMISYSMPVAIDLTDANRPAGLKAYKVSAADGSSVTLTEVTTDVAKNTGLILTGTAGTTYSIPVLASGTDISSTNKLVASNGTTVNNAAVLKDGQFHPLSEAGVIVEGKAYLPYANITGGDPFAGGAPALDIVFGGTTGIESVKGAEFITNGEFYNLAGQRVAQPTKGLYIVNGKKVIIK